MVLNTGKPGRVRSIPDSVKSPLNQRGMLMGTIDDERFSCLIENLQHSDPQVRREAILELGTLRLYRQILRAKNPLIKALTDTDQRVRDAANVAIMRNHATSREIYELLAKLEAGADVNAMSVDQRDCNSRMQAAAKLGAMGEPEAVRGLLNNVRLFNKDLRKASAEALIRIGEQAVQALTGALEDGDYAAPEARIAIVFALGKIGDRRAVDPLCRKLMWVNETEVKIAIIKALEEIGDARAIETLKRALEGRFTLRTITPEEFDGARRPFNGGRPPFDVVDPEQSKIKAAAAAALGKIVRRQR
jgi:HEAT repeat protein